MRRRYVVFTAIAIAVIVVSSAVLTLAQYGITIDKVFFLDEAKNLEIAREFVRNSPTFKFDGIEETLELTSSKPLETLYPNIPYKWEFVFTFHSRHAGYGDRTGENLLQVITPHTVHKVIDKSEVTLAVMDEEWNMIKQELVPK